MEYSKFALGFMSVIGLAPHVAYCETFGTPDSASKSFFPGAHFDKKNIKLSNDQVKKIEKNSGEEVRDHTLKAWVTPKKEVMFIDQVLGKHEYITYAVGVSPKGKVVGIEILEYRESYGQKVAEASWRKQFVGKDISSPLKLNTDIVNISGATLSSAHISAGVRRILQSYELIKASL